MNRPLAVPSPGGEGQDEGELLSLCLLPLLVAAAPAAQTKIKPDQAKKLRTSEPPGPCLQGLRLSLATSGPCDSGLWPLGTWDSSVPIASRLPYRYGAVCRISPVRPVPSHLYAFTLYGNGGRLADGAAIASRFENALTIKARQTPFNPAFSLHFAHHAKSPLTHCSSAFCAVLTDESALHLIQKSTLVSRCPSMASNPIQTKSRVKNLSFFSGHFDGKTLKNQGKMGQKTPRFYPNYRATINVLAPAPAGQTKSKCRPSQLSTS